MRREISVCVRACMHARTCVCLCILWGEGEQRAVAAISNRFLQFVSGEHGHTRRHTQSHYCSPTILWVFCNLCSTSQQGKWQSQTRRKKKRQTKGEGSEAGEMRKGQKQISWEGGLTLQTSSWNTPPGVNSSRENPFLQFSIEQLRWTYRWSDAGT